MICSDRCFDPKADQSIQSHDRENGRSFQSPTRYEGDRRGDGEQSKG